MERNELGDWLRLALSPGVGNDAARRLMAAFGTPDAIFAQAPLALHQVVSAQQAQGLRAVPPQWTALLETTWRWLHETSTETPGAERRVVVLGDSHYPSALLQMADPPLMLYALGRLDAWTKFIDAARPQCGLAIVGSRNPTPQGVANARQFAMQCCESGWTVVSGLALGVDCAAHQGALLGAASQPELLATVAVVGTGLDRVYPKANLALAHRIALQGLLLSEYPLGTPPIAGNFPKRNRLIAGLTRGTLVVEAALRSGSLITARLAVEQGKEVFAIPGSIQSMQSRGCHALIQQGAKLVQSVQDIFEEFASPASMRAAADACLQNADEDEAPTTPAEDALLAHVGFDPVGLDALAARTGLDAAHLQARLLELELEGQIARLPGGLFQRLMSS